MFQRIELYLILLPMAIAVSACCKHQNDNNGFVSMNVIQETVWYNGDEVINKSDVTYRVSFADGVIQKIETEEQIRELSRSDNSMVCHISYLEQNTDETEIYCLDSDGKCIRTESGGETKELTYGTNGQLINFSSRTYGWEDGCITSASMPKSLGGNIIWTISYTTCPTPLLFGKYDWCHIAPYFFPVTLNIYGIAGANSKYLASHAESSDGDSIDWEYVFDDEGRVVRSIMTWDDFSSVTTDYSYKF